MRRAACSLTLAVVIAAGAYGAPLLAWGAQGHRLVAVVAAARLTPAARQQVQRLLDGASLADVSAWADEQVVGLSQTAPWHYVNMQGDTGPYERDRDCPRQPGVAPGARGDAWRDCVVDRILYSESRLADTRLDRADRATALKFLVHLVGDVHQPFHALSRERGGNGIRVRVFGSDRCGGDPARPAPCNLHAVWDTQLVAHRQLPDARYARLLEQVIMQRRLEARALGTPADWAAESLAVAKAALIADGANVTEQYYMRQIDVVDERLALAGVRLAALLNRSLSGGAGR
jgi:hypothetical protein